MSRTKSIQDAIVYVEHHAGNSSFVEYEPGNGTRYLCSFIHQRLSANALPSLGFAEREPAGVFMFCWLNARGGGACHMFRNCNFLAASYVAEKLGCGLADAAVLAELIAHFTNRTAECAGYGDDVVGEPHKEVH